MHEFGISFYLASKENFGLTLGMCDLTSFSFREGGGVLKNIGGFVV